MRFRSKPTECKAVQWYSEGDAPLTERCARELATWVNANGGEARYERQTGEVPEHLIAVHTINGWAYASPGHYVVMGTATFTYQPSEYDGVRECRDFYPCDPETFERRWEAAS